MSPPLSPLSSGPATDFIPFQGLSEAIEKSKQLIFSQQFREGYWHYTLEANESIAAEYLLFHTYMGIPLEPWRREGLLYRLIASQGKDGSWPLYAGGPGSVGATTECYFALKLCGVSPDEAFMRKARDFIIAGGGALKSWVFTRIHLAMFGILPWETAPEMPAWLMLLPAFGPVTIYEFSSWARASIVPLLVIMAHKKTVDCGVRLDELFPEPPTPDAWRFSTDKGPLSLENLVIRADRLLKRLPSLPCLRNFALKRCEAWIESHLQVTADIFPALMYGAVALSLLGHDPHSGAFGKALRALKAFQTNARGRHLPPVSTPLPANPPPGTDIYQQCCISPTWDTAWAGIALIAAGSDPATPALVRAGQWLMRMQIRDAYGDWAIKARGAKPGGWAFEFQNDAFPDIDDTVEIMQFLDRLPELEETTLGLQKSEVLNRALDWVLAMQSENGGWAAFDKDNTREWVNRIPFSDHKACLDPPTADITARVLETLSDFGYRPHMASVKRALCFIEREQHPCGAWGGRWGVNYLYGTWCVLQGLSKLGISPREAHMQCAIAWLLSVQNPDGGWSESCESYERAAFVPLPRSTASQSAWAVLALIACGLEESAACRRGVDFLLKTQSKDGGWDEEAYTGTGFPRHFYIRYHGYRHYFPLLALGRYARTLKKENAG